MRERREQAPDYDQETDDRPYWDEYQRWCRKGFLALGVWLTFGIVVPSFPMSEPFAQGCYVLGSIFLGIGYFLLGRAVLSLSIRSVEEYRRGNSPPPGRG